MRSSRWFRILVWLCKIKEFGSNLFFDLICCNFNPFCCTLSRQRVSPMRVGASILGDVKNAFLFYLYLIHKLKDFLGLDWDFRPKRIYRWAVEAVFLLCYMFIFPTLFYLNNVHTFSTWIQKNSVFISERHNMFHNISQWKFVYLFCEHKL